MDTQHRGPIVNGLFMVWRTVDGRLDNGWFHDGHCLARYLLAFGDRIASIVRLIDWID